MPSTRNVRIAGVAFALIFTAYNTSQNYLTTLLGPELGSACLVLVYSGLICVTPSAPAIAPALGLPRALALGGATYCAMMVALLLRSASILPHALASMLVLLASFVNGMGGAVLWSAQGSLVILEAGRSDQGSQAGDFWALFHLSTIVGNAWAFFSFTAGGSPTLLFGAFALIAFAGCCLFAALRPGAAAGSAVTGGGVEHDTVEFVQGDQANGGSGHSGGGEESMPPPPPPLRRRRLAAAARSEARAMAGLVASSLDLLPLLLRRLWRTSLASSPS